MRRTLLLLAAVPLLLAPPALAHNDGAGGSVCRVPDIDLYYDTYTFGARVSLPVSGCASRENRQFMVSASISRLDHDGGRDVVDRTVMCGRSGSADDIDSDDGAPQSSCDMHVFLDHPEVERDAHYDVEVSYPGAAAERSTNTFTFCTSDGETASCEQ
jgi:hypothetical protein